MYVNSAHLTAVKCIFGFPFSQYNKKIYTSLKVLT